ncbi:hypothetical protein D039_3277 [Vibrio parahaemolyticus EKP-028]|nr:hypothetical protein D039_3277 [Vibrio parahaemolyticus EKP-028]
MLGKAWENVSANAQWVVTSLESIKLVAARMNTPAHAEDNTVPCE